MKKEITRDTKVVQRKELPTVMISGDIALMNAEKGIYYGLDAVGTRIWEIIKEEIAIKEIVDVLLKEYNVSADTCENDVIELIEKLDSAELIHIL